MDKHRRHLLALLGTTGVTTLAGCGSDDDGDTPTETPADGIDDTGTATETSPDRTDNTASETVTPTATLTPTPSASRTETPTDTDIPGTPTETPPVTGTPETATDTPQPQTRKLTPEDGDSGDEFGGSAAFGGGDIGVSPDGTTAVVGALGDDNPNGNLAGSAYVFQQDGGEWSEEMKLIPEDGDDRDMFGSSVGLSGDGTTAVVGAVSSESPDPGSVYVFQREGGAWSEETKLTAEDGGGDDQFGESVEVSSDGTTALIGAVSDDTPNGDLAGSVYVFQREGGTWSEETKLTPNDGDDGDLFGESIGVSSDGTTAVIGAVFDEDPNGVRSGSAYVFQREDEAWDEETKLTPEDGDDSDVFGGEIGVSSDGTTAVIGADEDNIPNGNEDITGTPTGGDAGSAYVFQRKGGAWSEETKLTPEDGDDGDFFGFSVGVSDDGMTTVIGASGDEDPNGERAGSAYVFQQEGENGARRQNSRPPTATVAIVSGLGSGYRVTERPQLSGPLATKTRTGT